METDSEDRVVPKLSGNSYAHIRRTVQAISRDPALHTVDDVVKLLYELEQQNNAFYQAINETDCLLQKYSEIFELIPVGVIMVGQDGTISMVNPAGAEIMDHACSELVGRNLELFFPCSARPAVEGFLMEMQQKKRKAACEIVLNRCGKHLTFSIEGVSNQAGDGFLVVMNNITNLRTPCEPVDTQIEEVKHSLHKLSGELALANQKQAQEISRHKYREVILGNLLEQQQKFASHLLMIREEERTAVAREIHDELGQMLASLQLNVSLITKEYNDHTQLTARAEEMEKLIGSSITTVQRISSGLRPVMLDQLGLADAMEWQAEEFRKKSGIFCKTILLLKERKMSRDLSTALFRIFQEALSNIMHHSGARHVQVELLEKRGWLTLMVRDDGRGITEKEKKSMRSLGIAGMRERARLFGGRFRISGIPQKGTVLFVRIPLEAKEERNAHQNTRS